MKCDGSCEEHKGQITRVHVWGDNHDWGLFDYCDTAKEEDRKRGLIVNEVEEEEEDTPCPTTCTRMDS